MVASASPNGLMPSMQRPWARYFSRFISAYRARGIDLWGVTVQNEPEAAVGWEACLWTPQFMAAFVRDHLGPVLEREQPGVKIIGFDHNKDHVAIWAKALYADPEAAKYFAGIGVHWYGGLNPHLLRETHELAPDKFILGTEACNCGGVVFREPVLSTWWTRAESLALDMLEDLRNWAVGWTDWNLVLSTSGGPNHLKNLCDANIIADPTNSLGMGTLIMQASFYYMGHFSRYIPPGSRRIKLQNSVEIRAPPLEAGDVKDGQALLFAPCDGNDVQKWQLDEATGALTVRGTDAADGSDGYNHGGECADLASPEVWWLPGKLQTWACANSPNQQWEVKAVTGGTRLKQPATNRCLTAVQTDGGAVGLDKGLTIVAAQLRECYPEGTPNQTFAVSNYDSQGFPDNFPVRTLPGAPGGGELCLQPQIVRLPHFDAVAFELPDKSVSLVLMNIGDQPVEFSLVDKASRMGVRRLTIPSHAIHTYRWKSPSADVGGGGEEEEEDAAVSPAAAAVAAATTATVATAAAAAAAATTTTHLSAAVSGEPPATSTAASAGPPATAVSGRWLLSLAACGAVIVGALLVRSGRVALRRGSFAEWAPATPSHGGGGSSSGGGGNGEWEPCEFATEYHEYGLVTDRERPAESSAGAAVTHS
jgi:hypothetical protein